jgi:hypothetical protein
MSKRVQYYRDLLITLLAATVGASFFPKMGLFYVGLAVFIAGFLFLPIRQANHWFWAMLTKVLGFVFQPIIFGSIFFVILLPLGLLFRLFRKKVENPDSTFVKADSITREGYFESPW